MRPSRALFLELFRRSRDSEGTMIPQGIVSILGVRHLEEGSTLGVQG
jgi:hypothetical protein